MKKNGRSAWLITWEGSEAETNGQCKVVAILPLSPSLNDIGGANIKTILRVLFYSHYNFTLGGKAIPRTAIQKDHLAVRYWQDNPDYYYGFLPKEYLSARRVKNLRCEDDKRNYFKSTLYWTELAKYGFDKEFNPALDDPAKHLEVLLPEKDKSYTYSIRPRIEATKRREQKEKNSGNR